MKRDRESIGLRIRFRIDVVQMGPISAAAGLRDRHRVTSPWWWWWWLKFLNRQWTRMVPTQAIATRSWNENSSGMRAISISIVEAEDKELLTNMAATAPLVQETIRGHFAGHNAIPLVLPCSCQKDRRRRRTIPPNGFGAKAGLWYLKHSLPFPYPQSSCLLQIVCG